MTIYEILKRNTEKHPERNAYHYFNEKGSYQNLLKRVDIFAKYLIKAGVCKGKSVAVCLPNTPSVLVSIFAINKLGGRAVMLNPKSPAIELRRQMEMSDVSAIIFSTVCSQNVLNAVTSSEKLKDVYCFYSKITEHLPVFFKFVCIKKLYPFNSVRRLRDYLSGNCICMDNLKDIDVNVSVSSEDNEEAVAIFSGGTGGEYKAIVHSSKSLYNSAIACENLVPGHPEELRMLSVLPSFHIFGLEVAIVLPLCIGGTCVLVPFFHMGTIAKIVAKDCPEFMAGVPTIFKRLFECGILQKYEKKGKLNVKNFIWGFCGGDYLDEETRCAFNDLIKRNGGKGYISMGYGMSECCPIAVCEKDFTEEKCVGKLLEGCNVKICDDEGNILPEGQVGEITLSSTFLMKKYFFEDGRECYPLLDEKGKKYIKTGDMGFIKNGRLYYEHRIRRIIKVSGNTIFAGYVENVIKSHPMVKDAIVVPVKHPTRGNSTFAFVICKEPFDRKEMTEEIIGLCKKELIPYAIPAGIEYCGAGDIKMTILGKVVYGELENKAGKLVSKAV